MEGNGQKCSPLLKGESKKAFIRALATAMAISYVTAKESKNIAKTESKETKTAS